MIPNNRSAKLTDAQKGRILSLYHDHGHSITEIAALIQTTVIKYIVVKYKFNI